MLAGVIEKLHRSLFASAARTATPAAVEVATEARGVDVIIDVTAVGVTPSVVFNIEGHDATSGKWYTILASAAITATGITVLRVFPGGPATANVAANAALPRIWRLAPVHGNATTITYSAAANLF